MIHALLHLGVTLYMSRIRFTILFVILIFLFPRITNGSIIFQDDFDTCTTDCNSCGDDYWDQWVRSGGCSATYDSTTHYSGEIVSPGRSGSGKLYRVWRHSTSWPDFSGGLVKYLPGSYNDIWFRYYIKIPAAMGLNGGEYCKWWIINPLGGEGVYLDIMEWEPGAGRVVITNYNIGGTSTVTVLDATDTAAILDGNWHSLQFHFNNTIQIGTLQLYVDGVIKYNNTSYDWGTTAAWYTLQHFHIGNRGSTTVWQNSWQAFEIDDFVMATTKTETDPDSEEESPNTISGVTGLGVSFQ